MKTGLWKLMALIALASLLFVAFHQALPSERMITVLPGGQAHAQTLVDPTVPVHIFTNSPDGKTIYIFYFSRREGAKYIGQATAPEIAGPKTQ